MKGKVTMKRLLFILVLVVVSIGATAQTSRPTWEYKFEYKVSEKKANEMASQGWELMAVGNESGGMAASSVPFMIFRRPK